MARIFANMLKKDYPCVNVRFLGLFDTVAQIGAPNPVNYQFGYNLDVDTSFVGYTAHAVAANEYRSTFPLTSISKSYTPRLGFSKRVRPNEFLEIQGANFYEKPFLGVHSDIGGAYQDTRNLAALLWMIERAQKAGAPFRNLNEANYKDFKKLFDLKSKMDHDSRYPVLDRIPGTHIGLHSREVFRGNN